MSFNGDTPQNRGFPAMVYDFGCRIQIYTRVREVFPDTERIPTVSTNTQIPRPSSQLHNVHRRIEVCIRGHTDKTQ